MKRNVSLTFTLRDFVNTPKIKSCGHPDRGHERTMKLLEAAAQCPRFCEIEFNGSTVLIKLTGEGVNTLWDFLQANAEEASCDACTI